MAIAQKGSWWRQHRGATGAEILRGVTNAAQRWVLVGENIGAPLIVTTEAGDETEAEPAFTYRTPAGTDPLNDVAYVASGVTVAACGDNGAIETSTNFGLTWSATTLGGGPDLYGIVGVSGDATSRFIAVGVDEIWGQDSGGTWTQRWSGSQTWRSVAHRPGLGWVAVGDNGWVSHSPTGAAGTWTPRFSVAFAGDLVRVQANSNYFIALSDAGYAHRSPTGLSGSWTYIKGFTTTMYSVVSLATSGFWAAFSQGFWAWLSVDDGDTWTRLDPDITRTIIDGHNQGANAMVCGLEGAVLVSYAQLQPDFVSTAVAPTIGPAFNANDDMGGDAVRRLVTQFRSGRG